MSDDEFDSFDSNVTAMRQDDSLSRELSSLIQFGVSTELINHLGNIRHQTVSYEVVSDAGIVSTTNKPRWSSWVVERLETIILCRSFHLDLYFLGNLFALIEVTQSDSRNGSAVNDFLWDPNNYSAKTFMSKFAKPIESGTLHTDITQEGVIKICYHDAAATVIDIYPRKVQMYAVLFTFLQDVLKIIPGQWQELNSLLAEPTHKGVQLFSNRMRTRLANYLKDHLRSEVDWEKTKVIFNWLREPSNNAISANGKNILMRDDTLIDFWRDRGADPESGFVLFANVVDCFDNFLTALQKGNHSEFLSAGGSDDDLNIERYIADADRGMDLADEIGLDSELETLEQLLAAEAEIQAMLTQDEEDYKYGHDNEPGIEAEPSESLIFGDDEQVPDSLEILDPSDAAEPECWRYLLWFIRKQKVRLLFDADLKKLSPILLTSYMRQYFPKSLARERTFSKQQNKIVQAQRDQRELDALVSCEDVPTYQDLVGEFSKFYKKIRAAQYCAMDILLEAESPLVFPFLLERLSTSEQQQFLKSVGGATKESLASADVKQKMSRFLEYPAGIALQIPGLNQLLREMSDIRGNTDRAGITTPGEHVSMNDYAQAVIALDEVVKILQKFEKDLTISAAIEGGLVPIFQADRAIFSTTFKKYYGAQND